MNNFWMLAGKLYAKKNFYFENIKIKIDYKK